MQVPKTAEASVAAPPADEINSLVALYNRGQLQKLLVQGQALAKQYPRAVIVHNLIGAANAGLGRQTDAITCFTTALRINPDFAEAQNNIGLALKNLGKLDEAIASYRKAVQIKPDFARAHYNLGVALRSLGKFEEAIASHSKALQIRPDFAMAHNNLGCALNDLQRYEEAIVSFTKALQIKPDYVNAHNNLGMALKNIGRFDEAIASYKTALQLKPDHVLAHRNLCILFLQLNEILDFENALNRARGEGLEDNPQILFLSALSASGKKNSKQALEFLERILPEELPLGHQTSYFELLGKTYEKLGLFDKAFAKFQTQNEIAKKTPLFKRCNPAAVFDSVVQLTKTWSTGERCDWPGTSREAEDVSIAFLVGFPRSGTTLLDTILRSHPGITVVEEKPMTKRMDKQFGRKASIEELNKLTISDLRRLRQAYLDELKNHVSSSDMRGLVIDKLPLNICIAGLIHRVFPKAKFILALRHPCDCVFSSFAQNFILNSAMANFLTLDQSAKFYAAVMGLWQAYRNALSLDVGVVKYEDLIQDLRGTCMPLIAFLGLEWDDNLLNYQKTARGRGWISTPSYDQVTQPLYKQASGRWKNYREPMQEVLPILEPWIKEFGYGD